MSASKTSCQSCEPQDGDDGDGVSAAAERGKHILQHRTRADEFNFVPLLLIRKLASRPRADRK